MCMCERVESGRYCDRCATVIGGIEIFSALVVTRVEYEWLMMSQLGGEGEKEVEE